jgi:hypothetical protein
MARPLLQRDQESVQLHREFDVKTSDFQAYEKQGFSIKLSVFIPLL